MQALSESYQGHPYTSARLTTEGKVSFYQGYIAARASIAMYNGYWPAIWAMGNASATTGWPFCGEVDFMEQVNGQSASPNADDHTQFGTLHYNAGGMQSTVSNAQQTGGSITNTTSLWGAAYHVYAFEWTSTSISFSVDGVTYYTAALTSTPFNSFTSPSNPFYLIIDLAMGGTFPNQAPDPTTLPALLYIDWIRVWQKADGVQYIVAPPTLASSSSSSTNRAASSTVGSLSTGGVSSSSTGTNAAGVESSGGSGGGSSGGAVPSTTQQVQANGVGAGSELSRWSGFGSVLCLTLLWSALW